MSFFRGKVVIITRPRDDSFEFEEELKKRGAVPIFFPTIDIVPNLEHNILDNSIKKIENYNLVIFTSTNGVKIFFSRLNKIAIQDNKLQKIEFAAIGNATKKEIEKNGGKVRVFSKEHTAEGFLRSIEEYGIKGKKFLFPRAEEARDVIPEGILKSGGEIDIIPVYKNVMPRVKDEDVQKLLDSGADIITFSSSSTIKNFLKIVGEKKGMKFLDNLVVACIGPTTAATAKEYKIRVNIVAREHTINGLIEALEDYYNKTKGRDD